MSKLNNITLFSSLSIQWYKNILDLTQLDKLKLFLVQWFTWLAH